MFFRSVLLNLKLQLKRLEGLLYLQKALATQFLRIHLNVFFLVNMILAYHQSKFSIELYIQKTS